MDDSVIKFYVVIGSYRKMNKKNDKILCVTTEDELTEDVINCLCENDVYPDAAEIQADDLLEKNDDMILRDVYTDFDEDGELTSKIKNFSIRVEKYNLKEYFPY